MMFNPSYAIDQGNVCTGCTVCTACGACGSCLACLADGPIPDFEGVGVVGVGTVGIVVAIASW